MAQSQALLQLFGAPGLCGMDVAELLIKLFGGAHLPHNIAWGMVVHLVHMHACMAASGAVQGVHGCVANRRDCKSGGCTLPAELPNAVLQVCSALSSNCCELKLQHGHDQLIWQL